MLLKLIQKVLVQSTVLMEKMWRNLDLILTLLWWLLPLDLAPTIFGAWDLLDHNISVTFLVIAWLYNRLAIWLPPISGLMLVTSTRGNLSSNKTLFILFSNGSWRTIWNIKFKDDAQMVELNGKLQVFEYFLWCHAWWHIGYPFSSWVLDLNTY